MNQDHFCICDDGQGFENEQVEGGHLGLQIMHERAENIGADLTIASHPGQGTKISVAWPGAGSENQIWSVQRNPQKSNWSARMNEQMPIRILLVDDHDMVRRGIAVFLLTNDDLLLVGEATNGAEALEKCAELHPDVVLMDLMMPVMDGVTAIRLNS